MKENFNSHKVSNLLLRLRSIVDCIESKGNQFLDDKVFNDAVSALENIKKEFQLIREDKNEDSH